MEQLRLIVAVIAVCVATTGCGGRNAKPITVYQNGDTDKTCEQLESEMVSLQRDAYQILPHTDKTLANGLWGTAAMFFVVPMVGMDLKNAEKVEFEAIADRHNYLLDIARNKGCSVRFEAIPSIEELKTAGKNQKK